MTPRAGNRLRILFSQAAFGGDPSVLAEINSGAINLAVWENALSPEARNYAESINLPELCKGRPCNDNYYFLLGNAELDPADPDRISAVEDLAAALPDSHDKQALVRDMLKLSDAFAAVADAKSIGISLIAFRPGEKPREGGYWHTDPGIMWTNITLAGKTGMIWRPDASLPATPPADGMNWGNVDSRTESGFIQRLNPGDLAVFKCRGFPNSLVHATPPGDMLSGWRLVMGMGKIPKRAAPEGL